MSDPLLLLVDDSDDDRELLIRAMAQIGFQPAVVETRDGVEALAYLFGDCAGRPRGAAPALTLLDLKMPRVGGLEVLRRARADERLKHLPVIILTSSDEENDRLEASRLGVTFYLTKPTDFDGYLALARRLQDMLAHHDR